MFPPFAFVSVKIATNWLQNSSNFGSSFGHWKEGFVEVSLRDELCLDEETFALDFS